MSCVLISITPAFSSASALLYSLASDSSSSTSEGTSATFGSGKALEGVRRATDTLTLLLVNNVHMHTNQIHHYAQACMDSTRFFFGGAAVTLVGFFTCLVRAMLHTLRRRRRLLSTTKLSNDQRLEYNEMPIQYPHSLHVEPVPTTMRSVQCSRRSTLALARILSKSRGGILPPRRGE